VHCRGSDILRIHGGVSYDEDHAEAMNDPIFEIGSGHLAYVFRHSRHSRLIHQDGSLTLNVLLNHGQTGRKIRHMHNECHDRMKEIDTDCIAMNVKSRIPAIKNPAVAPGTHLLQ